MERTLAHGFLPQLKEEFDAAHQQSMTAFAAGDYAVLENAIQQEAAIIEEQRALLATFGRSSCAQ